MRRSAWLLAGVASIAAAAGLGPHAVDAAPTTCKPEGRLVGHTVVFCGPATARLSTFPGARFRSGTCGT